ncbi:MAG: alcohol dehydrogenase catalytic domain-containing protein, partial [Trebonia sp.]
MRAIVYAEKGPSTVMRLAERPVPEPGQGQVRVRLVRAGVNPTDWKARAGVSAPMGFAEVTPGQDGAGVV